MNTVARPQSNELEALIAGSDNSPTAIREILGKLSASRVFAVTDKPWDGRSVPRPDMQLLLVTDGANQEQHMLALFSASEHARGVTGGDHPFKNVVEVDAAWAFLGVTENAGILINPNSPDAPAFRIGPAVAAELKKYAEQRLRARTTPKPGSTQENAGEQDSVAAEIRRQMNKGDIAAARTAVETALNKHPNDYYVLQLAGEIAIEQYRDADARIYFSEAVKVAPNRAATAASLSGLGQALTGLGFYDAAEKTLRQAMEADPLITGPFRALAENKAERGEIIEAIELLRRLATILPHDVSLYVRIADLLVECGQVQESLGVYDIALNIKPDEAVFHFKKGVALETLGRMDEAMTSFRKGQEIGPEQTPFYRIVTLKKFTSADDPDISSLKQRALDSDPKKIFVRTDAHFSLAKAYEDLGDYATAFNHLKVGNELKRSKIDFSIDIQHETAAKLIALFTPSFMRRFQSLEKNPTRPIFVLGMPRSGTTLMEQMLAGHPEIFGAGELSALRVVSVYLGLEWGKRDDRFPGTDEELRADFAAAAARYERLTQYLPRGTRRLTDKMPQNFMFIGLIDLMFKDYTIIHCRRNPVATGLSCYQHIFNKANMPFSYDLGELARYYRIYAELMDHWHKLLPGKILDVNYEDVVANPEKQLRRVLSHAGLEFDPACLEFHSLERPVATSSATQVRQPLYRRSIEKWKNYEPYLKPLIEGLGELATGWPKTE